MKIRFQMKNPAGNLLFHGLRFSLRNWPCLLWAYVINLGFGLLSGLPFSTGIANFIDNNLPPRAFANLNTTYWAWLFLHIYRPRRLPLAELGVLALSVAELSAMLFLAAGTVHIYFAAEQPSISNLLIRGKAYFWRFTRISLLGFAVGVPLGAGLLALRWFALRHVVQTMPERAAIFSIASTVVVLLAASPLRLVVDLIEVYAVRNGMMGGRRIRAVFRPAIRLLGHHLLPMLLCFLLAGLLGTGFLIACLDLWKELRHDGHLWLAYWVSQLGFFLLLATRFWQRGMEVELVLAAEPSPNQAAALPEVQSTSPQSDEPTLQDLLQRLKDEPWGKPEKDGAGNDLFPQLAPKGLAKARLRPAQDSLLADHEKKLRLLDPYAEEADFENPFAPPTKPPGRENGSGGKGVS